MVRVLIGGDLCPIGRNESLFEKGDVASLFDDLLIEFQQAELSIVNLECPLIREKSPIQKIGPVLEASDSCINGIKQAGIDVVNLANNHIMDHGRTGFKNTLMVCEKFGIAHVGAGENLDAARKILVREIKGMRIGILSLTEHCFSTATKTLCGANPLDVIDFVRNVKTHHSKFDYLIVLLHAGDEQYAYPSPWLMNICRFFIEQGASAVICQHSHCPGCYENYRDAHIVYGQGNLVFDMPSRSRKYKSWSEGFLVILHIEQGCKTRMEIVPYEQSGSDFGARRMKGNREKVFRLALDERSKSILDEAFVEKQWRKFCWRRKQSYLAALHGYGRLASKLNDNIHFLQYLISKRSLRRKLNLMRCESHREALLQILSKEIGFSE